MNELYDQQIKGLLLLGVLLVVLLWLRVRRVQTPSFFRRYKAFFFILLWVAQGVALWFYIQRSDVGSRGYLTFVALVLFFSFPLLFRLRFPSFWGQGPPVLGKVVARSTFGDRIEQVGDQLWRVRENGQRDVVTKEWLEQALQGSVWKKKEHA